MEVGCSESLDHGVSLGETSKRPDFCELGDNSFQTKESAH